MSARFRCFGSGFPFSTRSASADNRERLRKQAFRAISIQPFAERREDYQLPGAIKVQMFTPFEQSADANATKIHPHYDYRRKNDII